MPEMSSRRRGLLATGLVFGALAIANRQSACAAEQNGLETKRSAHSVDGTIARLKQAVTAEGWMVFAEIDHAAAAAAVGMKLLPRTVVLFGNPRNGTPVMATHSTLALDLPMRVLVWQDDNGAVFVTRNTGEDVATRVFARHGVDVPGAGRKSMDAFFAKLVSMAAA